jgi:serine/threonine protein kinase
MASDFLTLKFLGQKGDEQVKRELKLNKFLRKQCRSHFVCTIKGSFTIRHHLADRHSSYQHTSFEVIAYPPVGTDLQRIHTSSIREDSPLPLSVERRVQCVWDIVGGVAELHRLGIVHAGIATVKG